MAEEERNKAIEEAKQSLVRMRDFDVASLPRENELGQALSLQPAVAPAKRLIELYCQLPPEAIGWLNISQATRLKAQADADFNRLQETHQFDPSSGANSGNRRNQLVSQLDEAYETAFDVVSPIISYATGRVTDFTKIGNDARAMLQSVEDKAARLEEAMADRAKEADRILEDIRATAAEHGVSQQAVYFKEEADEHSAQAAIWLARTVWTTVGLAMFAVGTIFLHKWSWLSPATSYEAIQLGLSKFLVFATIASFLVLSARNFMAHRHNAVVNRHRQNALVTYRAIVDAAGDSSNSDIVLAKAAECIFSDQPSGFSRSDTSDGSPLSLVSVGSGAIRPSVNP
jgi:hypothetical protein